MSDTATDSTGITQLELATEIVASYVSNNSVALGDLPALIEAVHSALGNLGKTVAEPVQELKPVVAIKKSVTPDYIVCLEDGKKFKSLKRHLQTAYGLTPQAYREKWGLPADYPMVAPAYAAARSELAKSMGLGQARKKVAAPEPAKKAASRRKATA